MGPGWLWHGVHGKERPARFPAANLKRAAAYVKRSDMVRLLKQIGLSAHRLSDSGVGSREDNTADWAAARSSTAPARQ